MQSDSIYLFVSDNVSNVIHTCIQISFVFKAEQCSIEEQAMATHSSTLAWKIPWTEEPGGLPSMGSHRVRHDEAT